MLQLLVQVLEIDLEVQVMETYRKMLTKELFMSFTGFEEMKQIFPGVANVCECVIKNLTQDLSGIECNDQEAVQIASIAWEKLHVKYEAEL